MTGREAVRDLGDIDALEDLIASTSRDRRFGAS